MTLLPFQREDVVVWWGEAAVVFEVKGDRVIVVTEDGMSHLTSVEILASMQPVRVRITGKDDCA